MNDSKVKGSCILVTGGAGFIGSNLCEDLLANNNKVVCLDNFSTGNPTNIESFVNHPNFKLVEGDIRNLDDCRQAVNGVEFVLHHAALGSIPRSIKDPKTSHEVNVGGFLNMLQAAHESGVSRFVFASSSSVYGNHVGLPKVEDKIGAPLSPYAVTKLSNELYAQAFKQIYGSMGMIGLRYFNVFGKRQDPNGAYAAVIPKFAAALINHQTPVIYGDGLQSRDFTFIDNVVYANHLALTTNNPAAINEIFNIACENHVSLLDMVSLMTQELGKLDSDITNITPSFAPPRQGDILHSHASIQKAKTLLNYQPLCDFEEGLKKSMQWYWENLAQIPV